MRCPGLTLAFGLALAGPALAQVNYEDLYGPPVDVSITDLVQSSASYEDRAVRTRGRVELSGSLRSRAWVLRDGFGNAVRITPVPNVSASFESEVMSFLGRELEVTGVFRSDPGSSATIGEPVGLIQFWAYVGPPEETKGPLKAIPTTLEALVKNPGRRDGQTLQVVGKFRGRNLYGDLPVRSQRRGTDWVIKDDLYAVWITGKKPKGDGWELDAGLKRDTGKWVEVIGRPETGGGVTYIRALRVNLTTPPTPTAEAQAPPPPPARPRLPPVVVFALPLDGEADVPPNSRFQVQFSKDMDAATFQGRVVLRYAGPRLPGDREFDGLKISYDEGRRALTVDPGDLLRTGRHVELLLLPGIADLDGLDLVPRTGRPGDDAVDVLRFRVGG